MRRIPFLLMALLLLHPSGARGQEDLSVRVIPRGGLLNPDSYFYEVFASFAQDTPTEWTTGSLGRAAYVGLGLEAGWKERGIYLRGELGRSFEGWLSVVHSYVQPRVFFDPPTIINTWLDVPSAVTFAAAQLILPAKLEIWRLNPYFLLGAGGKWYSFDDPTAPNEVGAELPSSGFTGMAQFGGGIFVDLFGLTFDLQAVDTLNRYWGKYQHDLIFSGGLVWEIR
jgi:hypothetical protein